MTNRPSKKAILTATVLENKAVSSRFYNLQLKLKDDNSVFKNVLPGQFIQLDLSTFALPPQSLIPEELIEKSQRQIILRRPFSLKNIDCTNGNTILEILYCILGPATLRMKTLKAGDQINLIGPLGNGFEIFSDKKLILLVAGGMGTPPLLHLAKELQLKSPQAETIAFVGAKALSELPFLEIKPEKISRQASYAIGEFEKYNVKSLISTDDGSAGFKGFVTALLEQWLISRKPSSNETIIYSCGPEPMLAQLASISKEFQIPCQVSLERMMACGTGLCQSCAVNCILNKQTGETGYKLCCKDGPVFWADEVVF